MSMLFTQPVSYMPERHPAFDLLPFTQLERLPILWGSKAIKTAIGQEGAPMLYFCYNGTNLVYVGRSVNVLRRLYKHKRGGKVFTGVRVLPYPEYEGLYIRVFKPSLNQYLKVG